MQKLIPLLGRLTVPLSALRVDRLTIIGPSPSGQDGSAPLASKLLGASEQLRAATGIDVPKLLREKFDSPTPTPSVPRPVSQRPPQGVPTSTPPGGFASPRAPAPRKP